MSKLNARRRDERGASLIIFALLLVVLLGFSALLVDAGQARASRRDAQSISDMAALGGGESLSNGNPALACQDAVTYLNTNTPDLSPKITASSFCAQSGNNVATTTCSGGVLTQARPTTTVGRYTVTVVYPVLAADIADSRYTGSGGAGINDGSACQRMGVKVAIANQDIFGGVLGNNGIQTSRMAVVKAATLGTTKVPALWLLDPTGCIPLTVSGNTTSVTVGTSTVPGLIAIDSDGSGSSCNPQTTLSVAQGTLTAIPTSGTEPGEINLYALPASATTCTGTACDPNDLTRISPTPTPAEDRATRSPVDWKFNCKGSYPAYHGLSLSGCPYTTPAYIDNLVSAIGTSGAPDSTFQKWSDFHDCDVDGPVVATGNWWVDCTTGGNLFKIQNGDSVSFPDGNVVFDGPISMSGTSALSFNSSTNSGTLPNTCLPPTVTVLTACRDYSSANAAFVYMRSGDLSVGGGNLSFNHALLYQKSGAVKFTGGAAPTWTPPLEGPFRGLSLWSEKSDSYSITGGGGLELKGTFFTPEAVPFTISGGGGLAQQSAQFISYQLKITGGGTLNMAPDPAIAVPQPAKAGVLIR